MASQSNEAHQRQEIYFSGRVQGVGFRYTTRSIAARFAVSGFVENLPDGRVRLVAEGAPSTLARFVDAIKNEMDRCIDDCDCTVGPARSEFAGFHIRH